MIFCICRYNIMMHVARLLALWCIKESRIGIIGVMIIIVLDWCSVLPSLLHLVISLNYFLCLLYIAIT